MELRLISMLPLNWHLCQDELCEEQISKWQCPLSWLHRPWFEENQARPKGNEVWLGASKTESGTTMICLLEIFTYTVTTSWAGKDGPMRNFLKANLQWSLLSATFKHIISNPHNVCYCLILQLRNWISESWILHLNPSRPGSKVSQEAPCHLQVAAVVCSVYGDLGDVISARWKGVTQGTKKPWFQRLLQLRHSGFKAMYTRNAKYLGLSYYNTSNSPFGFVSLLAPFYKWENTGLKKWTISQHHKAWRCL